MIWPNTRERFEKELATLTDGGQHLAKLEAQTAAAQKDYDAAADLLSAARKKVAKNLDKAVLAELPPLKLEKARFETQITSDAGKPGPHGVDRVEFVVAANPGTPLVATHEGRIGRRAGAFHAGAQSHSRGQGLGAHIDLR